MVIRRCTRHSAQKNVADENTKDFNDFCFCESIEHGVPVASNLF